MSKHRGIFKLLALILFASTASVLIYASIQARHDNYNAEQESRRLNAITQIPKNVKKKATKALSAVLGKSVFQRGTTIVVRDRSSTSMFPRDEASLDCDPMVGISLNHGDQSFVIAGRMAEWEEGRFRYDDRLGILSPAARALSDQLCEIAYQKLISPGDDPLGMRDK